ncbi:hypothetical protein VTI74DRAFT_6988 [Chaetomium olivicolor]
MSRPYWWLRLTRTRCFVQPRRLQLRLFSAHSSTEHVRVPCASSGDITVSLHNLGKHDASAPLVIYIPPFSQPQSDTIINLPPCFQDYPTAVINYRWQAVEGDDRPEVPLYWPTPLHDVTFGYSWITANLGSGTDGSAAPRPAYVCGSYLGASLAAGLALTESHIPVRGLPMTIRGLIAHNGIYNWTMFLPDHPIHNYKPPRPRGRRRLITLPILDDNPIPFEEEGIFTELKAQTPGLFSNPSNLFDPFASACLFFHSANLHIPDDFTTPLTPQSTFSDEFTAAVDALANRSPFQGTSSPTTPATASDRTPPSDQDQQEEKEETAESLLAKAATLAKQLKPPRKGYLAFPPRNSTLRLPPSLLLYDRPWNYFPAQFPRKRGARQSTSRNNFQVQADELASLMRRSLAMFELRQTGPEASGWEEEIERKDDDGFGGVGERRREIERKVQTCGLEPVVEEVGGEMVMTDGLGLGREGEEVVREWLGEKVDEDFGE